MEVPAALRARFTDAGQGHVFKFVDEGKVSPSAAAGLFAQLERIDVALVNELYAATMAAEVPALAAAPSGAASALEPCRAVTRVADTPRATLEGWRAAGLAGIAAGRFAALILAGGQGTRLGSDRPKGEYDIGLPSRKPIFQLQAERVTRLRVLAAAAAGAPLDAVHLPVYVMTSPMTDADTRATWAGASFYGLPARDVGFFCQGTLPCLTPEGKIMLESGGHVAEAPDGNGGIYRALHLSGVLADMQARGVSGVHVFAVDNAVVKAADPTFLGFCHAAGADVGSKSCPKSGPHEKVGVLCLRDGVHSVVEYTEMPAAAAEARDAATGDLVFNTSNICIHYYSVDFLAGAASPARLPKVYHMARKAIPHAHPHTGDTLSKADMAGRGNTGIKLESFIFDVFPAARTMAVLDIERAAEFSPVKNAPGSAEDSPDTARALMAALHRRWLAAAGATVTGAADAPVEVSPLVSYDGDGLGALAGVVLAAPALVAAEGEPLPPAREGAGAPPPPPDVPAGAPVRVVQAGGVNVYVVPAASS